MEKPVDSGFAEYYTGIALRSSFYAFERVKPLDSSEEEELEFPKTPGHLKSPNKFRYPIPKAES